MRERAVLGSRNLERPETARLRNAAQIVQAEIGKRTEHPPRDFVAYHDRPIERLGHIRGTGDLVDRATDHAEFEPLGRPGIAEHHIAAMHADAELDRPCLFSAFLAQGGKPRPRAPGCIKRAGAGFRLISSLCRGKKRRGWRRR